MKYYISIFIMCSILFSCQYALEKPENVLSKKEVTNILTDIYLYKQTPDNIPMSKETAFDTYISIFKNHQTTKEIFQNSFAYYCTNPNTMLSIYDNIIENLEGKLTSEQLNILKEEEKQRKAEALPKKD